MRSAKQFWLMKSEPTVFSFDDLKARPRSTDHWEGVRNYQARNYMRQMRKDDLVLFYHSNCETPGVVGIAEVVREAYPDHTASDPMSLYYDPKSTPDNPRWFMVEVKWKEAFLKMVTLSEMRNAPELGSMKLMQKGQRLSVMPVTKEEFEKIRSLGMTKIAGISMSKMMDIFKENGVEANLEHENYLKGLKALRKVW